MQLILKSAEREVIYVSSLAEAKEALLVNTFESVFLDLNLKGELGLDLVPLIKSQNSTTHIFVITAQKDQRLLDQVEQAEVQQLIEKPLTRDKIFEAIQL